MAEVNKIKMQAWLWGANQDGPSPEATVLNGFLHGLMVPS